MHITQGKKTFANLPTDVVANATLLDLPSKKPKYLQNIENDKKLKIPNLKKSLLDLLGSPNISSKIWVYGQYDHEVGIRTVVKPGKDSSVLRLDNGKFLSVKIDGNPKHCYINPREGAIGCFEEACRNVVCTGAKPIGMLDHLQFGNPKDPEIFWTFLETLNGLADYAKDFKIPCVGGKVSLYNETPKGPIKPTPLIGVIGLIEKNPLIPVPITSGDVLLLVGETKDEMGGSEYYEYIHHHIGGICPKVDFKSSKNNMNSVLEIISKKLIKNAHDCSKGGLAIAVSELCMTNNIGCSLKIDKISKNKLSDEKLLFSESHSRYLLTVPKSNLTKVIQILKKHNVFHEKLGTFGNDSVTFSKNNKQILDLRVDKAQKIWINSLRDLILNV